MTKPLPCPFCGTAPEVYPKRPEIEGDGFGQVRCEGEVCPANPVVNAYDTIGGDYIGTAIKLWNMRQPEAEFLRR